jgi:hypothetical protein
VIALIAINLQALELINAIKFRTVEPLGPGGDIPSNRRHPIGRDATADRADLLRGWPLVFKALLATVAPLLLPPRSQGRKNKVPGNQGTGVLEGIDARLLRSGAVIDLTGPSCDDFADMDRAHTSALFEHIRKKRGHTI